MYIIAKRFNFEASHQLLNLPPDHPCTKLHGHSYAVEVTLQSPILDETGFVLDYHKLVMIKSYIDESLDHQHLNDVLSFNPTAENLAKHLFDVCKQFWPDLLQAVKVSETEKTWAKYEL